MSKALCIVDPDVLNCQLPVSSFSHNRSLFHATNADLLPPSGAVDRGRLRRRGRGSKPQNSESDPVRTRAPGQSAGEGLFAQCQLDPLHSEMVFSMTLVEEKGPKKGGRARTWDTLGHRV